MFFAFVWLGFCFFVFLGGATAAAMKSKAAVVGNRKELANRAASFPARLQ